MLAWRRFAFTSLENRSSKVVYRFPTVNLSQAVSRLRCSVALNNFQEEEAGGRVGFGCPDRWHIGCKLQKSHLAEK